MASPSNFARRYGPGYLATATASNDTNHGITGSPHEDPFVDHESDQVVYETVAAANDWEIEGRARRVQADHLARVMRTRAMAAAAVRAHTAPQDKNQAQVPHQTDNIRRTPAETPKPASAIDLGRYGRALAQRAALDRYQPGVLPARGPEEFVAAPSQTTNLDRLQTANAYADSLRRTGAINQQATRQQSEAHLRQVSHPQRAVRAKVAPSPLPATQQRAADDSREDAVRPSVSAPDSQQPIAQLQDDDCHRTQLLEQAAKALWERVGGSDTRAERLAGVVEQTPAAPEQAQSVAQHAPATRKLEAGTTEDGTSIKEGPSGSMPYRTEQHESLHKGKILSFTDDQTRMLGMSITERQRASIDRLYAADKKRLENLKKGSNVSGGRTTLAFPC